MNKLKESNLFNINQRFSFDTRIRPLFLEKFYNEVKSTHKKLFVVLNGFSQLDETYVKCFENLKILKSNRFKVAKSRLEKIIT